MKLTKKNSYGPEKQSYVNSRTLTVLSLFCALLITTSASPAIAATYYLDAVNGDDSSAGTSSAPWRTMAKAKSSVSPGDTVLLKNGNYGQVTFGNGDVTGTGWGENEKIVYKASDGEEPVFSQLKIYGSGKNWYTEFDGITINVTDTGNAVNLYPDGAHLRFLNFMIDSGMRWSTGETPPLPGFGIDFAYNIPRGTFEDVLIDGCEIAGYFSAIKVSVNGNITISNNETHFLASSAFVLAGDDGQLILDGNHIYDQVSHGVPPNHSHGSGLTIRRSNTIFRNNIIHNFGSSFGIATYSPAPTGGFHDLIFENNLIYDIYNYAQPIYIQLYSDNIVFRNNTIVGSHVGAYSGADWYMGSLKFHSPYPGESGAVELYNNVIVGALKLYDDASLGVLTGNIMWSYSDNGVWKSALPGNIVVNPGDSSEPDYFETAGNFFFGPLDYSLRHGQNLNNSFQLAAGSDGIGYADPAHAPATDLLGNIRDASPDAGCYEYGAGDPCTPTYTITATADSGGQISPNGSAQIISGGSQIYTITPDAGHQVADVLVDNSSVGAVSSYSFANVTSDHTISASFVAVDTYAITASAGSGGQISPNGSAQIISGGSQTYTVTPDTGYQIADVSVDNSSVGAVSSYSFTNVTSDHTISASFALADLNTNLVGSWEFEEGSGLTTADSSGNGNGTLANEQMWTGFGELDFDGDNDYVNCGTGSSLNITNSLTICARITPRTYGESGWGRIVDKGNGSTGFSFFLNQADSNLGYVIYGGSLVWSDSAVVTLNQLQHVAVVYDELSSTVTFYIDGQPEPAVSSNYQTNPIDSSNDLLFIGIRGYDLNRDFDGLIDDVRIYNRALSAGEIKELYSAGTSGNNPPVAQNDNAIVNEDSEDNVINVLANDADTDGDTLTITSVTQATNGTVVITGGGTALTYTPTPDYNGSDSFTYTISDGKGGIDTATVSVTVTNVPDAPILETIGDKTINENQTLTIAINATDADGDTITYSAQQLPPGTTFTNPFVWTPTYDNEGTYEMIFIASDGSLSDSETITITVNNVNRLPVAADDSVVTDEDILAITGNVLTNDNDADDQTLTVVSFTQVSHGTVAYNNDGTFTYTPTANYNGDDSFTYTVSDGNGGTDTATVQLDITPINDPPDVSAIPDTLQKYEGESILPENVELATDVDSGDILTYTYLPDLQATDYILHVDVSDGTVTVRKDVTIIVIPITPAVISVTATKYAVEILFSEDLEQASAENIDNYSLSNPIVINSLELNAERDTVTLYTTGHTETEGVPYNLTVANVEDLAGNPMLEDTVEYTYDSGLIGLWNFNTDGGNTALDTSGYDNTATLVNGPVWTEQGDLNFDGIDDAVEIPTNYWNINSGTVALWAYAEDLAGTHYLFGHTTGSGSDRIQLYTLDQNLNLGLGNSDELNVENLDSQTWHHIALTWDATNYVVYVDGIEKASGFYAGLNDLSESADIGNSGDVSFDNAFAGHIDDARVYERALTPDEVVNVYLMSDESIRESKALAFEVSATYPDGTGLTYSINQLPDGATFEDDTFTWNPWYDQAGIYNITFLPDDQQQPQYSQTMTIVVEDVQLSDWYQTWLEHLGLL